MRIQLCVVESVLLATTAVSAEAAISTAETKRVHEAAAVLSDFRHAGDKGIPEDLWPPS